MLPGQESGLDADCSDGSCSSWLVLATVANLLFGSLEFPTLARVRNSRLSLWLVREGWCVNEGRAAFSHQGKAVLEAHSPTLLKLIREHIGALYARAYRGCNVRQGASQTTIYA